MPRGERSIHVEDRWEGRSSRRDLDMELEIENGSVCCECGAELDAALGIPRLCERCLNIQEARRMFDEEEGRFGKDEW